MSMQYNNPNTTTSTIGKQFRTDVYERAALIDAKDELRFTQIASTTGMPKHHGKEMQKYRYIRILDDRNSTDQGLDKDGNAYLKGNMYGGSRDITTITTKAPSLGEDGGRKNRVGMTRLSVKGTIQKLGFFSEYTAESMDFDTDADLYRHYTRELMQASAEVYEDMLAIDLINGAGVVRYSGVATNNGQVTGEGTDVSLVSYDDLKRVERMLNVNKAPTRGKVLTGSTMYNTTPVDAKRVLYIGYELQPVLEAMVNEQGDPAFIPYEKYGSQVQRLAGEIGTIYHFRVVIAPRMPYWAGGGASATSANGGYSVSNNKYDVFPMLVCPVESFTTFSFHSGDRNKAGKFIFKHKPVGEVTHTDPYGETGIISQKWWYGTLITDPLWLAVIKTVAPN